MNIEKQVTSLELSKRLKELGVKQESLFYWIKEDAPYIWYNSNNYPMYVEKFYYSAFTASELGEMLPNYVLSSDPEPFNGFRIYIEKFISVEGNNKINNWILNYHCDTVEVHGKQEFFVKKLAKNIYDPNLANAMAKMLIHLLENGMIESSAILTMK